MPQRASTFFVKGEKIKLCKDSTWIADGIEITHEPTRDLFYKSIHWDAEEKKYCLKVGYETMFIEVEDTPYFVTALIGDDAIHAKLSNFTEQPVRASSLEFQDNVLYLRASDGQRAKFLSAPYHELLAKHLGQDDRYYFVTIAGERVNLSPLAHPAPEFPRAARSRS